MATKDTNIPDVVDFSTQSIAEPNWLRYLVITFSFILFCRLLRIWGIVNRLHKLLIFLCSVSTADGRKRRAERSRLSTELKSMRAELKTIDMVKQFVAYSKLERRIKATTRQLEQLAPETFDKSIIRYFTIKFLLFICEGILMSWLILRAPSRTVTKFELEDTKLRGSFFLPLLNILYYLPSKLVVIIWIAMCHSFCTPIITWTSSKWARTPTSSSIDRDSSSDKTD